MAAGNGSAPDRNLALELVRVTEAAALGCARWVGRGDKEAADQAAVDAMRAMLDTVAMDGVVVIGEGEKDKAPMLFNGEEIGNGEPPEVDVAVDPLEGTRLTSVGQPNAISVIAVAERGTMFFPGAAVYMDKIAVGPEIGDAIDIGASPEENVRAAAEAKGVKPSEIAVVVLDRERNQDLIGALREVGAKVNLITDGDVAPAIAAARPGTGVDLMMGIGGTPEGVIAAAAVKCLGGAVQGRLWPRTEEERRALLDDGYDLDRVLTTDDLVGGDNVFVAATGVTDGALLRGARCPVQSRPVRERLLAGGQVRLVAVPGLERGRLERAPVGEGELPGMGPDPVQGVQVRRRLLVALTAGEEHYPRDGGGNDAAEAADRRLRDLLGAGLGGALLAGQHHVRLQEHPLVNHALGEELVEDRLQRRLRHLVAALDRMAALHHHLGLHDGHEPGLLRERGEASERVCVHVDQIRARNTLADVDDGAPFRELRAEVAVLLETLPEAVEAFRHLLVRGAGEGLRPRVHLDPGNDSCV